MVPSRLWMPYSFVKDVLWHSVCQTISEGCSVGVVRRGFHGALGVGMSVTTAAMVSWLRRSVPEAQQ